MDSRFVDSVLHTGDGSAAPMTSLGLPPLPSFRRPPINEVVLGIQFDAPALTTPYLGLYWAEIRQRFPKVQIQPALDPVVERFGESPSAPPFPGLKLLAGPETPRCWFLDASGNRLIQLQQDRLLYNWRRVQESDEYPRYESVRSAFASEHSRLARFASEQGLAEVATTQCEATYVNHIPGSAGPLEAVFTPFQSRSRSALGQPEHGGFALTFVMDHDGKPAGRLHVGVQSAVSRKDRSLVYVMNLTVRGEPRRQGLDGVLDFMDSAHEWIVRGFTDLTSAKMHEAWERTDG